MYNAINGTKYTDPNKIIFNTIDDVIYMGMKNDISFIIDDEIDLFEHQSTFNPNMPVRQLIYLSKLYEGYLSESEESIYSSTLIKLPSPKIVVFYNGTRKLKDETILKLSDSFPKGSKSDVEVKVRMININSDANKKLMKVCKPLGEYALFIDNIRKGAKDYTLSKSIDKAIQKMPDNYEIKSLIIKHQAEVKSMLITEYNEVAEMKKIKNTAAKKASKRTASHYSNAAIKALMNTGLSKQEAKEALEKELKSS